MPSWHKLVNDFMPQGSKMATKKKQATSAHDLDRIIIRLPEGMREKVAGLAAANGRSMTAEVVAALERHLQHDDKLASVESKVDAVGGVLLQLIRFLDPDGSRGWLGDLHDRDGHSLF
jgi:Arc-like DNA binding domain